jgi:hypothetical protein
MKFNVDNLEQYKKNSQKRKRCVNSTIIYLFISWLDDGYLLREIG